MAAKTGRHLLAAFRVGRAGCIPPQSAFTRKEWAIIQAHRTPRRVQHLLDNLPYNWEKPKETLRSFRGVIAKGTAHCLEAAILAAVILEQHGHPPLMLSLESTDKLDHVLYLFKQNGRWGAVGRSREAGLQGRQPVFRSVRELVFTYVEPYVDYTGRLCGYGVGNLWDLGDYDWRFSRKNVWKVEKYLLKMPHKKYRMSKRTHRRALRRFTAFRAADPKAPVNYYDSRPTWLGNPNVPSGPIPKKFRHIKPHYGKE